MDVSALRRFVHPHKPTVISEIRSWWREQRQKMRLGAALRSFGAITWEFLRDSMPDRKRQRYGDADYDWVYRVDTTSANVSWRARFIGLLHSSYQPIERDLFQEMLNSLGIDYSRYTFIDIGSGKGRALLMASEYPFRRVLGVELLPELNRTAQDNIRRFPKEHQRCEVVEAVAGDATQFAFPQEPIVVFMFHPLAEIGFTRVLTNLQHSLCEHSHPVWLIYANPIFEVIVMKSGLFRKTAGSYQYSVFGANLEIGSER